jgi:hypothetical protein
VIRDARLAPHGIFGDLHFNPKHALAEQLAWDAEHAPENVGLSHNVVARVKCRGAGAVVEAITHVYSVDLVADPATTRGLFEQVATTPRRDNPVNSEALNCEELTLDQLRANRPDLVTAIIEEIGAKEAADAAAEIALLKTQNDAFKAREEQLAREGDVRALLVEAELSADSVSEVFFRQLMSAGDADCRQLIADRVQTIKNASAKSASRTAPVSKDQHLVEGLGRAAVLPTDPRSFANAIR